MSRCYFVYLLCSSLFQDLTAWRENTLTLSSLFLLSIPVSSAAKPYITCLLTRLFPSHVYINLFYVKYATFHTYINIFYEKYPHIPAIGIYNTFHTINDPNNTLRIMFNNNITFWYWNFYVNLSVIVIDLFEILTRSYEKVSIDNFQPVTFSETIKSIFIFYWTQ